jgi:hypothetical protein
MPRSEGHKLPDRGCQFNKPLTGILFLLDYFSLALPGARQPCAVPVSGPRTRPMLFRFEKKRRFRIIHPLDRFRSKPRKDY